MANDPDKPDKSANWPSVPNQFKPGTSGNPGGKPTGARNRLTAHFLNALAEDFEVHGKSVIARAREDDPIGYVKVIGALMPKQIEQTQPLDDLTDGELLAGIALLRSRLTDAAGTRVDPPAEPKQVN